MSNERDIFERLIKEDRYDQEARLVFSDWLEEHGYDDEALVQRSWTKEKQEAEDWLRDFAKECGKTCKNYEKVHLYGVAATEMEDKWVDITYEDVVLAGSNFVDRGESFVQFGSEEARNLMMGKIKEKYWKCWELVTGRKFEPPIEGWWGDQPFSCSC